MIQTEHKGRGVVAKEPIYKGDFVLEYVGQAVMGRYVEADKDRSFMMHLEQDIYIDAHNPGGIARYINHSCEPNCIVQKRSVEGVPRLCIYAKRNIDYHDELTFDYGWDPPKNTLGTACECRSRNCRGTIEQKL